MTDCVFPKWCFRQGINDLAYWLVGWLVGLKFIHLFWETEGEGQRARIPRRLGAQYRARCWAWSHDPHDRDLSESISRVRFLIDWATQAPQWSTTCDPCFPVFFPPLLIIEIFKSRKRTSGTIICQAALVSHVCQSYSLAHTLYRSTSKQIADIVVHPQRLQHL